jgi:hypothetical protein
MKLKGKRYLFQTLAISLGLLLLFALTSPDGVGVGFLLFPVILIFLFLYSFTSFILVNTARLEPRTRFLNAFTIGAGLTLLAVLSSVGSLTVYDLIVVVLFIAVSAIYIKKSVS